MSSQSGMTTGWSTVSSLPTCRLSSNESSSPSKPLTYGVRSTVCSSLNAESSSSISTFTVSIFSATGLKPNTYRLVRHRSESCLRANMVVRLALPVLSRETRYRPVEMLESVPFKEDRGTVLPDTLICMFRRWTNAEGLTSTLWDFDTPDVR